MKRRHFIQKVGAASGLLAAGAVTAEAFAAAPEITRLSIMHTNDMHSRIDPFPLDGGKYEGMGGISRRAALIEKNRLENPLNLLLDAGDIFQGTPYFNVFGGELEFKLMSQMKYDAATMGNHDFDGGIDGFEKQLQYADFPFTVSNYDFSDTVLNGKTKDYFIIQKEDVKIGIFGIGIELEGLVPKSLYKNTIYRDPIKTAGRIANILKNEEKCDLVICLSHLGFEYDKPKVSDKVLAANTSEIDLIVGGHTHTFLDSPVSVKNLKNEEVIINQAGWGGIVLGRLDFYFEKSRKNKCMTCKNQLIA